MSLVRDSFLPSILPRDGGPVSASVCERRATADLAEGQIEDPLRRTRPLTLFFFLSNPRSKWSKNKQHKYDIDVMNRGR